MPSSPHKVPDSCVSTTAATSLLNSSVRNPLENVNNSFQKPPSNTNLVPKENRISIDNGANDISIENIEKENLKHNAGTNDITEPSSSSTANPLEGTASTLSIIMALVTTAIGAGMVEFPAKLAEAGWVGGLGVAIGFNGVIAACCGVAMTRVCDLTEDMSVLKEREREIDVALVDLELKKKVFQENNGNSDLDSITRKINVSQSPSSINLTAEKLISMDNPAKISPDSTTPHRVQAMADVVERAFPNHKAATTVFDWFFNGLLISASAVALCIMGMELRTMFKLCGLSANSYLTSMQGCVFIIFIAMLLLNQVRDVSCIARLSYLAVSGILLTIGCMIAAAFVFADKHEVSERINLSKSKLNNLLTSVEENSSASIDASAAADAPASFLTILKATVTCFFGYGFRIVVPTFRAEMKNVSRMSFAVLLSAAVMIVTYIIVAVSGLVACGKTKLIADEDMVASLPDSDGGVLIKILLIISILVNLLISYPCFMAPALKAMDFGFYSLARRCFPRLVGAKEDANRTDLNVENRLGDNTENLSLMHSHISTASSQRREAEQMLSSSLRGHQKILDEYDRNISNRRLNSNSNSSSNKNSISNNSNTNSNDSSSINIELATIPNESVTPLASIVTSSVENASSVEDSNYVGSVAKSFAKSFKLTEGNVKSFSSSSEENMEQVVPKMDAISQTPKKDGNEEEKLSENTNSLKKSALQTTPLPRIEETSPFVDENGVSRNVNNGANSINTTNTPVLTQSDIPFAITVPSRLLGVVLTYLIVLAFKCDDKSLGMMMDFVGAVFLTVLGSLFPLSMYLILRLRKLKAEASINAKISKLRNCKYSDGSHQINSGNGNGAASDPSNASPLISSTVISLIIVNMSN